MSLFLWHSACAFLHGQGELAQAGGIIMGFFKHVTFAAAAVCTMALPALGADRDKLRAFMEITGFDVSLEGMRQNARTAPEMLGLSADDFGLAWTLAADDVFDPDTLMDDALTFLEKAMEDDTLSHAAAFYASDLGQRLVAAENASHVADDTLKKEQGAYLAAELSAAGSIQPDIFLRMADAVGAIDQSLKSYREVQVRFILSAQSAGAFEKGFTETELRQVLASKDDQVKEAMAANIISASAFAYDGFTDDEMVAYLDALSHPKMRRAYDLMNAIQYTIMADRYEQLAARLAELTPSQSL